MISVGIDVGDNDINWFLSPSNCRCRAQEEYLALTWSIRHLCLKSEIHLTPLIRHWWMWIR